MLDLWLDGLASEVREARWERVFERCRQCFDKGSARARRVADAFALMAREKLAGSSSGRLACASASADFGDERGAGLDKNIGAGLVAMENYGARRGGRSEHGAFVAIGAGVGVRLTFQPAAEQNQLRSSIASRLSSRAMPEDVHSARGAERDNRAAGKFQLREASLRTLDNIALPQMCSLRSLQHSRTANDAERAFDEGDGTEVLRGSRDRQQQCEEQCNAEKVHVDPDLGTNGTFAGDAGR